MVPIPLGLGALLESMVSPGPGLLWGPPLLLGGPPKIPPENMPPPRRFWLILGMEAERGTLRAGGRDSGEGLLWRKVIE